MHTRYCLLYELGRCRKMQKNKDLEFPLFLVKTNIGSDWNSIVSAAL